MRSIGLIGIIFLLLAASAFTSMYTLPVAGSFAEMATSSELMLYNFVELADESEDVVRWWTGDPDNGYSLISFGGPDNDPNGFAMYKTNIKLNDGIKYSKVLETHPKWVDHGEIVANYYNIYIPKGGAKLHAKVGFIQGGTAGDAYVYLYLVDEHHNYYFLVGSASAGDHITYSGGVKTYSVSVPSSLWGKTCTFGLRVYAGSSSAQDWVAWPYIYLTGKYVLNLASDETSVEIVQGESTSFQIHISGDYPGPLTLSASGVPAGVQVSFSPSTVSRFSPDSVVTITAADDAETGTFNIVFKAKHSPDMLATKTITLKVSPKAHPDFTIDVSPSSTSISRGDVATFSISINPLEGFNQPVSFSISGVPSGTTYEFTPSSGTPPFISTLRIETSETTPLGTHTITITASGGGKTHSKSIHLTVEAAPDFSIKVEPLSITIKQGESAEYVIGVASLEGFSEEVSLSVSGLPSGATLSLSQTSGTPPLKSIMKIQTSEDTPPGSYTITVTGTGGGKTHSASAKLIVEVLPSFSITLAEEEVSITQGESVDLAVDVGSSGGFSGVVELFVRGLKAGLTASFDPESDNAPYTSTLTITASKDTPPGTYELMVVGVSGELTRGASLTLEVKAMPSFEVSVSPSSASVVQGEEVEFMVEVKPSGGFSKIVNLSIMNTPSRTTATFSKSSGIPPFSSTLTIRAEEDAPVGDYSLTLKAEGDGISKTRSFKLSIKEAVKPFDFSLEVTPSSVTIKPGGSTTMVVLVNLRSGKAEPVSLTAAGLPSDFKYSFDPPTVTPTGSSTLHLTAGNTPGSYTLVVQASGGKVVKTVSVHVEVVEEKRCLIATAAFGSEVAPQVQVLREFRDGFVMKTFAGENFMKTFNAFYYSWSPYVARAEYENPVLRDFIRITIYPLIYSLEVSRIIAQPFSTIPEFAVLVSGIIASLLIGLIYVSPILLTIILASRWKKRSLPNIRKYYILLALAFGLLLFSIAEVSSITIVMMLGSAIIVLACIALGAILPTIAVRYLTDRKN